MRSAEQCNRCRFWLEDGKSVNETDRDSSFGWCRAVPPRLIECVVVEMMPKLEYGQQVDPDMSALQTYSASLHPSTHSTDWCGSFFDRAPETPLC